MKHFYHSIERSINAIIPPAGTPTQRAAADEDFVAFVGFVGVVGVSFAVTGVLPWGAVELVPGAGVFADVLPSDLVLITALEEDGDEAMLPDVVGRVDDEDGSEVDDDRELESEPFFAGLLIPN